MKHTLGVSTRAGVAQSVQWLGHKLAIRGSISDRMKRCFLLQNVHLLWGPPTLLFNCYRDPSPVVKRPGHETNHSPPSRTQLKNVWSWPVVTSMCLIFMLPCIVIDFLLNNQPYTLIIQIYSVIKVYIFRASAVPSWLWLEAVIRNLHETYQCRMRSRKLLMMGREDARNM